MSATALLLTPPFTQLNTPYPATAFLKGFLNKKNIRSFQADLGIEVAIALFSNTGLKNLFNIIESNTILSPELVIDENATRIINLKDSYIDTIDNVILFLQGKNSTLAHLIIKRNYLPEAGRFEQLADLQYAFGTMGIQDKAKHLATLYLEDLSDLIKECVDTHFGLTRYAERLGRSAASFDGLFTALQQTYSYIDTLLIEKLSALIHIHNPQLVAISVPFPGNLFAAFRCGQYIKKNYPDIKVAMGGGFANTELRSLSDIRVFNFFDFITLDDGELPIENIIKYINKELPALHLKRTFLVVDDSIKYINNADYKDYKQEELGTPDYSDFLQDSYISAIEVVNPMHSLWSDGRWNKLMMAHGCYWGKCTFCDISLDYIKLYEPIAAFLLCDRIEEIIKQTGQTGFHFVDEAAPPALMRALAIEIIKRKITINWWTNIRFEKSFTRDLCILLREAGCIAVSGGLEVASDRLLELIQKGITVAQVARVNKNFTDAGIMVHAYLMYGFPTQTVQETIDSLEMVRQMFEAKILQSAFWHLFAMTAHSPVGMNPEKYFVKRVNDTQGQFANNDLEHIDTTGDDHELFSEGLKKSLFNYMHDTCFDFPLQKWFDFKVPKTKIVPDYMNTILKEYEIPVFNPTVKIIYLGNKPKFEILTKSKKGNQWQVCSISFYNKQTNATIQVDQEQGLWLVEILDKLSINNIKVLTLQDVKLSYEQAGLNDFELFWDNKPINTLYKFGLLRL